MVENTIGIDVSKDTLEACRLPDGRARRFANTSQGRAALIRWLGDDVARVVFEPTAHYARELERDLAAAGVPAVKVNPKRARRFVEAVGTLAKTDRVDAEMLALMGLRLDLAPTPAPTHTIETLKELQLARRALVRDRTAARNRVKRLNVALLMAQNHERLQQIQRDLQAVDAEIRAIIQDDPELKPRFDILASIPGISEITAAIMLSEMPELGALDAKAAASLAGLAPVTRQSGAWKGRAYVRGGRAHLRHALYMPALVAARFNPDLARVYDRLVQAGKPPKLAITAIMRKLIVLANALLQQRRLWTTELA